MYNICTFELALQKTQSVAILAQEPLDCSTGRRFRNLHRMLGRPVCVELPDGQVAKVLEDHIHGDVTKRLPYSTMSMRKRPRWP